MHVCEEAGRTAHLRLGFSSVPVFQIFQIFQKVSVESLCVSVSSVCLGCVCLRSAVFSLAVGWVWYPRFRKVETLAGVHSEGRR